MTRIGQLLPCIALLAWVTGTPLALNAAESQTSPEQASQFIRDLSSRTMTLLGQYSDGEAPALQGQLRDLIRTSFDLELIGRGTLGTAWQSATPAQQDEYQRVFVLWTADTYAQRLGADRGGSLTVIDAAPDADSTDALVRTEIKRPYGISIDANLRVRGNDGQMKIVDVTMGGVSMVTMQRDEFAAVIRRRGLDVLIGDIRRRVDNLNVAVVRR
jgi:phospholipid transport system substrate-binding protein